MFFYSHQVFLKIIVFQEAFAFEIILSIIKSKDPFAFL